MGTQSAGGALALAGADTGTCTYALWITDDRASMTPDQGFALWDTMIRSRGFLPTEVPVRFIAYGDDLYAVGRVKPAPRDDTQR